MTSKDAGPGGFRQKLVLSLAPVMPPGGDLGPSAGGPRVSQSRENEGGMTMPDKRILIVAVGDPSLSPAQQEALRPLIPAMQGTVRSLAAGSYTPIFDYAVAPLGPGPNNQALQSAIQNRLGPPKPDVIFTIASAATKAARDIVRGDAEADGIPIVFTVVSEPDKEPPNDPFIPPGTPRLERITGVSRGLVQSAREAVKRFKDVIDRPLHIHWISRQNLHQAKRAHTEITKPPPLPTTHFGHHPPTPDCKGMVHVIENNLPLNTSSKGPLPGLFLIPDDLVGSCAGDMIRSAHDPARKIPTLVQQLEWVCRAPQDPTGPPALAGWGVTPEWVGTKAGGYVHTVIQSPDDARSLPVLTPSNADRKFWINMDVAATLGVPLVSPLPAWAKPCPGQAGAAAAAATAKMPQPAAAKAPPKQPKKKAAKAPKAKVSPKARPKQKARKVQKRTAARKQPSGGRRPKRK
jgi:hypothetical protein